MSILSSQILQRYSMVMLLVLCAPQGVRAGFFDEILFYFCGFTLDQIDRSEILGPMGGRISPMNQPRSPGIQLVSRFNGATQVPVQVPVYQQQAMHQRAFSFGHPLGQTPQVFYVQKLVYQGQIYQEQGTSLSSATRHSSLPCATRPKNLHPLHPEDCLQPSTRASAYLCSKASRSSRRARPTSTCSSKARCLKSYKKT